MGKRSIVFVAEVEIEISHVEARRIIREYELANSEDGNATNHSTGSWSKDDGRYFIHLRT